MKSTSILIFIFVCLAFSLKTSFGQGDMCINASPFCTDTVYDFPMSISTMGESGPNYGCLHTFPNPAWYYLKIGNPGWITININGNNGQNDVDFICWGPFTSLEDVCTDSLYGQCAWGVCPNNTSNPNFYPAGGSPNIIDCSYDPAPIENCHILNAQTGKYYLLCLTNYSGRPGNLSFSKVAGTATTDCSILSLRAKFNVKEECEGVAVNFADSSYSLYPVLSRLWEFGDGQTDTAKFTSHVYAAAGKYLARLTITSEAGSSSVAHYITVHKLGVSFTPQPPINICHGDSVNLRAVITTYPLFYDKKLYTEIPDPDHNEIRDNGILDSNAFTGEYDPPWNEYYFSDTVSVSGINPGWNINNITVNIEHPNDDDIMVYLKAPGTIPVQLIKNCGGAGNNFTKTSFIPPPLAVTSIKNGTAPFSGSWIPSGGAGIWGTITGFVDPNGLWIISIGDGAPGNIGKCLDWSIEFSNPKQTKYTYKWLDPINDSTHLSHVIYPTDTTTYGLTAYNEFGCSTTSYVTVNVVPDPIVIVSKDTTICAGDTATLNASGASTYTWMPGNITGSQVKVSPEDTTTYIITGANQYGCKSTDTVTVNVTNGPDIDLIRDTTICLGTSAILTARGAVTYYWMPGHISGPTITVSPEIETDYYVYGADERGCITIDTITVRVDDTNTLGPEINLIRDTTIYVGTSATITASGAYSYYWRPIGVSGPTITVSPMVDTDYYVFGSDISGCITIDTVTVKIDFSSTIFVPNTFSPNGDFQNDILYVRGGGMNEIEFTIYDRWGEKIFYSNSQDIGWDGTYKGKNCNPGVFVYFLKVKTFDNKIIEKKGNITLIR